MSNDSSQSAEQPVRFTPHDVLPRVEPPNATFLLQLFLIPLLIVSLIVLAWIFFSWLASSGGDPREMVKDIREGRGVRWQRAVTLASVLSQSNSQLAELRQDPTFAEQVGDALRAELKSPLSGAVNQPSSAGIKQANPQDAQAESLKVRYYLCRTLGLLESTAAIPPLLEAAEMERHPVEVNVRLGAIEGLIVLAKKLGTSRFLENKEALSVLLNCSRAEDVESALADAKNPNYRPHGEIRGAAAFALGVLNTEETRERLAEMLNDPYPIVRYNAATGLAFAGDARCQEVLLDMLDLANEEGMQDERAGPDRDNRKIVVLKSGIDSAVAYCQANTSAPREELKAALEKLSKDSLDVIQQPKAREGIRLLAQEGLNKLSAKSK